MIRATLLLQLRTADCLLNSVRSSTKGNSSNIWLDRQRRDPYVKRAVKESYRARSAFKLLEINEKHPILTPGDVVIDIGACPGSWSQVAVQKTNSLGTSELFLRCMLLFCKNICNFLTSDEYLKDPKLPVGKVIAIDKDYIDPLDGAHLFSFANINDPQTITKVRALLGNEVKANAVLSDMV